MSTFLVVNNSSILCSSTASAPYIQVNNECLPLTTQTDRGRIDIHVTDEQTTYNVINLTTTTREMTVESTVDTTGYSGTYKDVEGEGTEIDDWGFNHVYALLTQTNTRYTINSYFLSGKSVGASTPAYITYTFADVNDENTLTNSSMLPQDWINCSARDAVKMPGTTSTYIRPKMTISGNDFIVHYSTTAYISSRITKYNSAYASNRSYYTTSVYSGVGTVYNSFATYTAYSSESNASASDYCEHLTSVGTVTLTDTVTEEVTSSSFTTQTHTDTQTKNATIWSASTSEEASGSCTTTVLSASYGQGYRTVNSSNGGAYQTYMTYRYSNVNVNGTMSKSNYQGEQTLPCNSTYLFSNSTSSLTTHQASWWYAGSPDSVTVTNNSYTTIDQSTYTGGGYNYSVTQTTNSSAFDTYSTYSTSIESLRTNTMRRTTYSSYETTETSSASNETYSNSYTAEITETLTFTETVTGEVH